jgi:hypothetical protein
VAQLVFEFGSDSLEPTIRAASACIGGALYRLMVMPTDSTGWLDSADTLDSVAKKLRDGLAASFILYPQHPCIRHVLVSCPFFAGQARSTWMGTVEIVTDDYEPLWKSILRVPGLQFVCLGFEEGVDLSDRHVIDAGNFPWDDDFLVVGAVRSHSSSWHIQKGRRYLDMSQV